MNYYPVLENERARLRPVEAGDELLLGPIALATPELWRFMSSAIHTPEDLAEFVRVAIEDRTLGRSIPFVIFDKETDSPAGSTRFGAIELKHKRLEIGWTWIGRDFQGTGLNRAIKYLMLEHAFDVMGMNRVEIKTNELNTRSRRAIEGIGAVQEGIFRHHMVNRDGSLRNTVYYSILKEEWPEVKARLMRDL